MHRSSTNMSTNMSAVKSENNEWSPQTVLQSTHSFFSETPPSLMLENREPSHNTSSVLAGEVGDVRPCNRAINLGLPPLRMTSNTAQNNYLRDARLADYFSPHPRGGQPPAYHAMNGQEQTRNPSVPQHNSQNTSQKMAPEMIGLKKNLSTFNQNANNFAIVQAHLFNSLNARLVKAEYERDCLRAALSQYQHQQPGSRMSTPQTAPEFGSRMATPQTAPEFGHASLFRDDGEDAQISSPTNTPCKPPQKPKHFYSSPIQHNTSSTPFGSKLTGNKKQKKQQTKARKDLKIKVPGQLTVGNLTTGHHHHHHSTTASTTTTTTLTSPLTPGRIGPPIPHPPRPTTIISKRKIHNLEKLLPPATALIPLMPLTDTEIIVYFFQSLARPIVSLRLYARNWGPSNICDTLNAHRAIQGGYLRNTASVKCTTAIKRGKERFGEAWADELRDVFANADDIHATDLMQLSEEEKAQAADFRVRDLSRELKMHPRGGVDGGVFTECVKWCVERRAGYTLGNVHELALALRRGEEPDLREESEEEESGKDEDS